MHLFRPLLPLALSTLALSGPAFGQTAPTVAPQPAVALLRQQYDASFDNHPQLYSGLEYADYTRRYHKRTGDPFFFSPEPQPGSVDYNNHHFGGVRLNYDEVLDQVLLTQPNNPVLIRLIEEQLRGFALGPARFVRLVADSASGSVVRTGYYQVLADGRAQVLARRTKRLQEHLNQPYVDVEFVASTKFFVQKGGQYYPVRSKSNVVRLLADRSKDVQQYLKAHPLKFNKAQFEPSVVELVAYYNGLPPQ